jgi:hypothetical protein
MTRPTRWNHSKNAAVRLVAQGRLSEAETDQNGGIGARKAGAYGFSFPDFQSCVAGGAIWTRPCTAELKLIVNVYSLELSPKTR